MVRPLFIRRRCWYVTSLSSGEKDKQLIVWTGVIEDARFKRKEALADLASVVGKKK